MIAVSFFVLRKLYCPVHLGLTWHVVGADGKRICLDCRLIGNGETPNIVLLRPGPEKTNEGS